MQRKASAVWQGGLKDGKGTVSTESKVLSNATYSFSTRFERGFGTNPEELIAAAHAACFSMALSGQLEQAGFRPNSVSTSAAATLMKSGEIWSVTDIHLEVDADVPGIGPEKFTSLANEAKRNCPISRLLNATITLSARLKFAQTG